VNRPAGKKAFRKALRGLPLVFLALVLWREKPWTVHLAPGAPWAIAAAIVVNLVIALPLKAVRWGVALRDPPPFRRMLAATLEGMLANAALGVGSGDVVRAARLRKQLAVDYACTWAERGAEALAFAILLLVAALLARLGALALALSALPAAIYAVLVGAGRWLVPRLGRWPRAQHALASGLEASTPRRVAAMVGLSLLAWASEVVMLVIFQSVFHLPPSVRTALVTLIGINAAIAIPAVPGNFGTFEAGAAAALVFCGAPRDVAISFALTYHLSHVVPVALLGTLVSLRRPATAVADKG